MMGRVRVMLLRDPGLHIDIMGPLTEECGNIDNCQVKTDPSDINPDVWEAYGPNGDGRLNYINHMILPNALATRYDFQWTSLAIELDLGMQKIGRASKYDIVYLNDPMHLRNFKAMFHVVGGYQPKFVVHSHFIDDPDCPKFPTEASLWLGQCEAAIKADWNFWQCESSMNVFFEQMAKTFNSDLVEAVKGRSEPWDDGYSMGEIQTPYDAANVRFDIEAFKRLRKEKVVIFVPNRIGGKGRSSDYTNCGKFMFEHLPELAMRRRVTSQRGLQDYIVICGNPSQKIFNDELEEWCGNDGYVSLVSGALNRDEFKCVASNSDIAIGLYNQDTYGGTVARECVELGCLPLWADCHEYASIADAVGWDRLTPADLSMVAEDLSDMICDVWDGCCNKNMSGHLMNMQEHIRKRCSYEETTKVAYERMKGLL